MTYSFLMLLITHELFQDMWKCLLLWRSLIAVHIGQHWICWNLSVLYVFIQDPVFWVASAFLCSSSKFQLFLLNICVTLVFICSIFWSTFLLIFVFRSCMCFFFPLRATTENISFRSYILFGVTVRGFLLSLHQLTMVFFSPSWSTLWVTWFVSDNWLTFVSELDRVVTPWPTLNLIHSCYNILQQVFHKCVCMFWSSEQTACKTSNKQWPSTGLWQVHD